MRHVESSKSVVCLREKRRGPPPLPVHSLPFSLFLCRSLLSAPRDAYLCMQPPADSVTTALSLERLAHHTRLMKDIIAHHHRLCFPRCLLQTWHAVRRRLLINDIASLRQEVRSGADRHRADKGS